VNTRLKVWSSDIAWESQYVCALCEGVLEIISKSSVLVNELTRPLKGPRDYFCLSLKTSHPEALHMFPSLRGTTFIQTLCDKKDGVTPSQYSTFGDLAPRRCKVCLEVLENLKLDRKQQADVNHTKLEHIRMNDRRINDVINQL